MVRDLAETVDPHGRSRRRWRRCGTGRRRWPRSGCSTSCSRLPERPVNPSAPLRLQAAGPGSDGARSATGSLRGARRRVRAALAAGRARRPHGGDRGGAERRRQMLEIFSGAGMEEMGINLQDMFGNILPKRKRKRKLTVAEARKLLAQEEAQKLIDMDEVTARGHPAGGAVGIIFIDEIDKIAGREGGRRARRLAGRGAARHPADRRGLDGDDQVRPGPDRPHAVHRGRGVPRRQAQRPHPRASGRFPDPRRARKPDPARISSGS